MNCLVGRWFTVHKANSLLPRTSWSCTTDPFHKTPLLASLGKCPNTAHHVLRDTFSTRYPESTSKLFVVIPFRKLYPETRFIPAAWWLLPGAFVSHIIIRRNVMQCTALFALLLTGTDNCFSIFSRVRLGGTLKRRSPKVGDTAFASKFLKRYGLPPEVFAAELCLFGVCYM